jgi:hypothetical protein
MGGKRIQALKGKTGATLLLFLVVLIASRYGVPGGESWTTTLLIAALGTAGGVWGWSNMGLWPWWGGTRSTDAGKNGG